MAIKILSRTNLPGAGFTTGGVPKQGKTRVVAEVSATHLTATPGVSLTPSLLGLETIDFIQFKGVSAGNGGTVVDATNDVKVTYNDATQTAYVTTLVRSTGAETVATNSQTVVFKVDATGDSALAPALV